MSKKCIIVDLDNTLVEAKYLELGMTVDNWNWAKFGNSMRDLNIYKKIEWAIHTKSYIEGAEIIVLTARPSFLRDLTEESLKGYDYDRLITKGDIFTKKLVDAKTYEEVAQINSEFKKYELAWLRSTGYDIIECYEDNPVNIQMMESLGLKVIKCNKGEFV